MIIVVSVSELTELIFVTDENPGLHSVTWIVKFDASAIALITSASAHVPYCDILAKDLHHEWFVLLSMNLSGLFLIY